MLLHSSRYPLVFYSPMLKPCSRYLGQMVGGIRYPGTQCGKRLLPGNLCGTRCIGNGVIGDQLLVRLRLDEVTS
jgi:hypothetical protein